MMTHDDTNDTTRAQINNIPEKSHVIPLLVTGDRDRNSPYNINTVSSRQVMKIKKNISKGIMS